MEKCNVGEFIMFTCAQTLSPSLSSVATVNQLVRHVFALALLTSATERSQCIRKHNDLNRVETPLDTQHSNNRYDSATLSAISPPCSHIRASTALVPQRNILNVFTSLNRILARFVVILIIRHTELSDYDTRCAETFICCFSPPIRDEIHVNGD